MKREDLQVGQTVIIHGDRSNVVAGVVKIGRQYVHLRSAGRTLRFEIDSQREEASGIRGSAKYFRTQLQEVESRRWAELEERTAQLVLQLESCRDENVLVRALNVLEAIFGKEVTARETTNASSGSEATAEPSLNA